MFKIQETYILFPKPENKTLIKGKYCVVFEKITIRNIKYYQGV